jgi:hypothetical protein
MLVNKGTNIWTPQQSDYIATEFTETVQDLELETLIEEACYEIDKVFGETCAYITHEDKYDWDYNEQRYLLIIMTTLDADSAFKRLKQLDEEWWIANCKRARDRLSIDVGFA